MPYSVWFKLCYNYLAYDTRDRRHWFCGSGIDPANSGLHGKTLRILLLPSPNSPNIPRGVAVEVAVCVSKMKGFCELH
jgi:hypothetical protein